MRSNLKNQLMVSLSWLIIILGLVSILTPIPGAVVYIALGLTLLIHHSPKSRVCIQWIRTRYLRLNGMFNWLETKTQKRLPILSNTIKKTQPLNDCIGKKLSHKAYVKRKLAEEQAAQNRS